MALICLTAPQDLYLREGCQLIPTDSKPEEWKLVHHNGNREDFSLDHSRALDYAKKTATEYGVGESISGDFNSKIANQVQSLSEENRKALLRQGPVTDESIKQYLKKK